MGSPKRAPVRIADDAPTIDDPLVGSVLADTYRVEAIVADGGMSRLYRAKHTRLGLTVAIKVAHMSRSHRPESAERAEREARALAKLECEHVVKVLDLCITDDQRPCVVTELLRGEDLAEHLASHPRLPVDRAVALALDICRGLEPAHKAGLVHRDLKPSNVYLAEVEGREVVKVLDFGVVKLEGAETLTHEGAFVGTPGYMAPEQAEAASDVDERADVYAVGAILYRMLSGEAPYGDLDAPKTLAKLLTEPPVPLAERSPTIPADVAKVVDDAMSRDPGERIPTVRSLRERLEALAPAPVDMGGWARTRALGAALSASLAAALWLLAAGAAFVAEVELRDDWSPPTPETIAVAACVLGAAVGVVALRRLLRAWRSRRALIAERVRTMGALTTSLVLFALVTLIAAAFHWLLGKVEPFVPYERCAILSLAALTFIARFTARAKT
ncbi:MAG: serine/threonine protein kinase [Deltaproteobacteria bacterium]|nr:serine/threonine protein kinase [Deltaproteobacteria bacterium]